jgi:hypothetical protein
MLRVTRESSTLGLRYWRDATAQAYPSEVILSTKIDALVVGQFDT